jgi:hypothetical protein
VTGVLTFAKQKGREISRPFSASDPLVRDEKMNFSQISSAKITNDGGGASDGGANADASDGANGDASADANGHDDASALLQA